jgi:hypothetical protein
LHRQPDRTGISGIGLVAADKGAHDSWRAADALCARVCPAHGPSGVRRHRPRWPQGKARGWQRAAPHWRARTAG